MSEYHVLFSFHPTYLILFPSRIDISPEFSFDHMLEFSKLAVAFAIEPIGGWEHEKIT
jgi:hypothetical protein